ncbi:MAG: hypothetical protein H0W76_06180 [Pyrinomonadaceae bacterium]|nr:hypothetical protein [Pyrinomonadaceae bacterium]
MVLQPTLSLSPTFSSEATSATVTSGTLANIDPFGIGGAHDSLFNPPISNPFDGLIDELSIYRRALSDTEIQAIYNVGSAGKCKS